MLRMLGYIEIRINHSSHTYFFRNNANLLIFDSDHVHADGAWALVETRPNPNQWNQGKIQLFLQAGVNYLQFYEFFDKFGITLPVKFCGYDLVFSVNYFQNSGVIAECYIPSGFVVGSEVSVFFDLKNVLTLVEAVASVRDSVKELKLQGCPGVDEMAIEDKLQLLVDALTCEDNTLACIIRKGLLMPSNTDDLGKGLVEVIDEIEPAIIIENDERVESNIVRYPDKKGVS